MLTALIDYESGNLHSALKAFEKMAAVLDAGDVVVTSDPDVVARADRLVLPGDGAFPACRDALINSAIYDALCEAVEQKARPFMGICVGMQLMAKEGHEYTQTPGLGWIDGAVHKIAPADPTLKIPHMGWNNLVIERPHPIFDGVETGITPISCIPIRCRSQAQSSASRTGLCGRCHGRCGPRHHDRPGSPPKVPPKAYV